jgi:hypothetical protein
VAPGNFNSRWHIQAVKAGNHEIKLGLKGTKQSLSAQVHVQSSIRDQISEIVTAIQLPLNAEIAARLQQLDHTLGCTTVQDIPFRILPVEEFISELYEGEIAIRLNGMLRSARREQWFNPKLLNIVLNFFLPTYLPGRGVFIPYAPNLASSLAELHPRDRRFLENNLLASNESSVVQTKQNIAAYLLHERYGHGFFYTQTRLGKQLAALYAEETKYKQLIEVIDHSSTIVNEGFATWVELHFLKQLSQEIQPMVNWRQELLIEQSSGMFELAFTSDYFQIDPPIYDSRYREGFEYFSYIAANFHPRCVIQIMKIVNEIDLGIEVNHSGVSLRESEKSIKKLLLNPVNDTEKSNVRLRRITTYLRANETKISKETRKQYCPHDCNKAACPLLNTVEKHFQWRLT